MGKRLLAGLVVGALVMGGASLAGATPYQVVIGDFDDANGWSLARSAAQALGEGWDLVSITSQEENDLIAALLGTDNVYREEYWIGAQRVSGSTFAWVSGEAWSYSNWWSGEPNGDGVGAAIDWRGDWAWNDEGSATAQVRGFVAEYTAVPEPSTLLLLGSGLLGLVGLNRRRTA